LHAENAPPPPARPIIVGYFPQSGVYRQFFLKNLVANGSARLLDQINYAQGIVVNNRCALADANADMGYSFSAENSVNGEADTPGTPLRGNFHQLLELKRLYPQLKILISLEGNPELFALAAQPGNRRSFVSSCIDLFIRGHLPGGVEAASLFDGVDLDWEYPEAPSRFDYIALLGEFRRQFNLIRYDLRLSVASGDNRVTYQALDMASVALYVDQVGVMNYDYSGPWSRVTGLIAPLFGAPGDPERDNDIDGTMRGYRAAGVPVSKLLLGVPFYAYCWEQVGPANHGLFQAGKPVKEDAPYSHVAAIQQNYTEYRDPKSQSPWLYNGQTFWTYDDATSIRLKMQYANQQKLAGVMIWDLSGDTGDGSLLKAVAGGLRGSPPEDEARDVAEDISAGD
jgi:chitinase